MTLQTVRNQIFTHRVLPIVALMAVMLVTTIGVAWAAHTSTTVTFPNFDDPGAAFQLNGSAAGLNPNDANVLRLNESLQQQSGSAFLFSPIDFTDAASFSTQFSFRIHDKTFGGADGLAFVIQPT